MRKFVRVIGWVVVGPHVLVDGELTKERSHASGNPHFGGKAAIEHRLGTKMGVVRLVDAQFIGMQLVPLENFCLNYLFVGKWGVAIRCVQAVNVSAREI